MLIAGQLLLVDSTDNASDPIASPRMVLKPGTIRTEGDRIAEVILGEIFAAADAGGPDCLIAPGFIDTHLHLPQFDAIGAHGMRLLDWLDRVILPIESTWRDPHVAAERAHRALSRCLRHGTTAVCAYATVHHEATAEALRVASELGIRGVIGQTLMDREAPAELLSPADRQIEQTERLLKRFLPSGRVAAAVTPRYAVACSPRLMRMAGDLARSHSAIVQTHLAETLPECARVRELFAGRSYVDAYDEAGLLGPRSIFGHGIYLSPAEVARLVETGSVIAHCPLANSFLASGMMPRARWLASGVKLTLGSDIGAGYEVSMPRVARGMIETATARGDLPPTAAQAWHAITAGNADMLGWHDAGRIETGASADILVIRPDVNWRDTPVDPLARTLFGWDDRWLEKILLRGEWVP
jgi:guanine deaminase